MKKSIQKTGVIAAGFVLFIVLLVVLAGMFKFNYLAHQPGYDVDGNKIQNDTETVASSSMPAGFQFVETLDQTCQQEADCQTPAHYAMRSVCPYTTKCVDQHCTVVCPDGFFVPEKAAQVPAIETYWVMDSGDSLKTIYYPQTEEIALVFDDRTEKLKRIVSASGEMYANEDETYVFASKGDEFFIEEKGTVTFQGKKQ